MDQKLIKWFTEYVQEEHDPNFRMPTHRVVCERCNGGANFGGRGGVDAWEGGMTAEEMEEQGPDFIEDYMNGHYTRTCPECQGKNVVDEVDEDRLSPEMRQTWHDWVQQHYESEAISRQERMMGA